MRIDSAGNVGIGTSSPAYALDVRSTAAPAIRLSRSGTAGQLASVVFEDGNATLGAGNTARIASDSGAISFSTGGTSGAITGGTERMRIDSSGRVFTANNSTTPVTSNVFGIAFNSTQAGGYSAGIIQASADGSSALLINRGSDDGGLVGFFQAGTQEGNISVSGTTVSYNGGHLSRWSQLLDGSKDNTILKGTVMSNLDDMCVWEKDGVVAANEQLNKMKVSDVEGDTNVAGVFVNWTIDDVYGVDDMNVAMTGDMIIRIADGVVVQKGDLLMSAGDGTAKPQGDDIVRSKTIAKVTSNYVSCTYADGSYCVPCVLMAC
jgi:hypothetical protein